MKRTMLLLSIFLLATLISGWVNSAEAQKAGKVYRIGFLDFRLRSATSDLRLAAFRQGLRELGYVEGHSFVHKHFGRLLCGLPDRQVWSPKVAPRFQLYWLRPAGVSNIITEYPYI